MMFSLLEIIAAAQPEENRGPLLEGIQNAKQAFQGQQADVDYLFAQARTDAGYVAYEVALLRRQVEERDRTIARLSGGGRTEP